MQIPISTSIVGLTSLKSFGLLRLLIHTTVGNEVVMFVPGCTGLRDDPRTRLPFKTYVSYFTSLCLTGDFYLLTSLVSYVTRRLEFVYN